MGIFLSSFSWGKKISNGGDGRKGEGRALSVELTPNSPSSGPGSS